MLTAHRIIAIRRQLPTAEIKSDEDYMVRLSFPNGDKVVAIRGLPKSTDSWFVVSDSGLFTEGWWRPIESDEGRAAEAMLRGFLGC